MHFLPSRSATNNWLRVPTRSHCVQAAYHAAVDEAHAAAAELLQRTCVALHSSAAHMGALLTAHEVSEWGSTLAQVTAVAALGRWTQAELAGAAPAPACS
jgi:hypothetical protein